uniref:Uncharacterized protein n=1 Tax=Arundo donax TaxID=35708 RepID=A0A0A9C6U5_ARUDO
MPPTIRHLSILTGIAYNEDLHGSILRNKKFEEKNTKCGYDSDEIEDIDLNREV